MSVNSHHRLAPNWHAGYKPSEVSCTTPSGSPTWIPTFPTSCHCHWLIILDIDVDSETIAWETSDYKSMKYDNICLSRLYINSKHIRWRMCGCVGISDGEEEGRIREYPEWLCCQLPSHPSSSFLFFPFAWSHRYCHHCVLMRTSGLRLGSYDAWICVDERLLYFGQETPCVLRMTNTIFFLFLRQGNKHPISSSTDIRTATKHKSWLQWSRMEVEPARWTRSFFQSKWELYRSGTTESMKKVR